MQLKLSDEILLYHEDQQYLLVSPFFGEGMVKEVSPEIFEAFRACANQSDVSEKQLEVLVSWQRNYPGIFYRPLDPFAAEVNRIRRAYQAAKELNTHPDLDHYHREVISDAKEQFENVEVTLSHTYATPQPGLRGQLYGSAFCQKLFANGFLKPDMRMLEAGGGTGFFAQAWLDHCREHHPEIYMDLSYTLLDLSPALQTSQREQLKEHLEKVQFLSANMETFDFEGFKFDLIISNEVIADLTVKAMTKEQVKSMPYQLDVEEAPQLFLVNTGAISLLEKFPRILKPGGHAVLTEYGSLKEFPMAVPLGKHVEYSIRFDDLIRVARSLGFKAELKTVGEWMDFASDHPVLGRSSYVLVSDGLLPFLKRERLERRAYAVTDIQLPGELLNLKAYPLKSGRDLLSPYHFQALIISAI